MENIWGGSSSVGTAVVYKPQDQWFESQVPYVEGSLDYILKPHTETLYYCSALQLSNNDFLKEFNKVYYYYTGHQDHAVNYIFLYSNFLYDLFLNSCTLLCRVVLYAYTFAHLVLFII